MRIARAFANITPKTVAKAYLLELPTEAVRAALKKRSDKAAERPAKRYF